VKAQSSFYFFFFSSLNLRDRSSKSTSSLFCELVPTPPVAPLTFPELETQELDGVVDGTFGKLRKPLMISSLQSMVKNLHKHVLLTHLTMLMKKLCIK